MNKIFMALMVAMLSLSMSLGTAEAKRLGGGSSFGKQSFSAQRQMQSPRPAQAPSSPNAAPAGAGAAGAAGAAAKSASPWKGILGGALLGLGLGALLSHLGIGGAFASMISTILMIAIIFAAIMFVMKMLRRKSDNAQNPAYASGSNYNSPNYSSGNTDYNTSNTAAPEIGSAIAKSNASSDYAQNNAMGGSAASSADYNNGYGIPAGFDAVGFARQAKVSFIRLQAAWDKADLDDIREFTTPEMFAELSMQIGERHGAANHTDVVSIDAEVLGVETIGNDYMASIRFFGFIREEENTSPAQFQEIWNLTKPINGNGGWLLAGIQQVQA